ncbi:MAG TPA: type I pantothenate kinase, partial [Marmoricola sp.]|nr:type I pantothenate kinase [Marmoricola sp.]
MSSNTHPESSPYLELDRDDWAALAHGEQWNTQPLSVQEIEQLRGLGDGLDMDEVQQIYLPLSRL